MKKSISLGVLSLLLLSLAATPGLAQDAKEILEKMIEAQGGRKLLEGVMDVTISGSVELTQMGMSATVTVYQKKPKMMRTDIEVMGMVITQAFDGETAWVVNPQTGVEEEMPERMAEYAAREAIGVGGLLNPEKYGLSFEYKGKEEFEGKKYLVIEQTFADGYKNTIYIDPDTYLTYKSKGLSLNNMMVEVEAESFASDYKKVNGMMAAHSVIVFQDGEEFMTMTITEIKINTGLEDSLFKMSN